MRAFHLIGISCLLGFAVGQPVSAAEVDEAQVLQLLRDSKCLTCHSVDKKKDGPAYTEVAKKHVSDAEAIAKLTEWVSTKHNIEIDGEEEEHGILKTRDAAKIDAVVQWILSR